jgi:organic radical activating enzyme
MDQPTGNKQLRLYNKDNQYKLSSVDEIIANNLNTWKNWKCSAGVRSLYIDYDGNVWIANCASATHYGKVHDQQIKAFTNDQTTVDQLWKEYRENIIGAYPHRDWIEKNTEQGWPMPKANWETCEQHIKLMECITNLEKEFFKVPTNLGNAGHEIWQWKSKTSDNIWGLQGSIFTGWTTPTNWVTCPFSTCGCGADVILSKAKDDSSLNQLHVTTLGYEGQELGTFKDHADPATGIEMNFPIDYQILWDITRRCNYNCDYCWPSVHNNTEEHHDYNKIIETIDKAINDWSNGSSIRWNFGGGEPTMNPKFLDILKHLKQRNQWVLVTTNGSRSKKYWKEASKYINSVNMSAHFDSMDKYPGNETRFIENCEIIINHHKEVSNDHWLEIKLMTPPGMLDRAIEFKNKIVNLGLDSIGANDRQIGAISLVPIRDLVDSSKLVGYSDNEIRFFQQQA